MRDVPPPGRPRALRIDAAIRAGALAAVGLALALPAFFSLATPALAQTATVSCTVIIDGKARGDGECRVGLNRSSTFIGWADGNAYLSHDSEDTDDAAQAHWTGEGGGGTPSEELGHVRRDGSCWQGSRAQICYSDAEVSAAVATDEAAAGNQATRGGSDSSVQAPAEGIYDEWEDEGEGPDTPSDFGDAIAGLAEGHSMTCTYSMEDASRPGARMMMRGLEGSDYQGGIPEEHGFAWDGGASLSIDGSPSALMYRDGETVAARLTVGPALANRLPDTFTEEDQKGWQRLQGIVQGMNQITGEATGIKDRVIVLDFDKRTAVIATWMNGQLSEAQAVGCM